MGNENKGQNNSNNNNPREKRCIRCEYTNIQKPSEIPDDGLIPVNILSFTPENIQKAKDDPRNYHLTYLPTMFSRGTLIVGSMTNTNLYSQLNTFVNSFLGIEGPNFVDTRDNKITVHNGKMNGNPVFAYTYMGGTGELLDFSITTKYTETINVVKRTSIDPDDKSINTEVNQGIPTEESNGCQYDMLAREWDRGDNYNNRPDDLRMAKFTMPTISKAKLEYCSQRITQPIYNSESEAISILSNTTTLTAQEVAQYNAQIKAKYEAMTNPKTEEDYALLVYQSGNLEDLIVKRKVFISVDPKQYAPQKAHSNTTPTVTSGGVMPRTSTNYNKINWSRGYEALKKDPERVIIEKAGGYRNGDRVLIEMVVEVPIPGVRVISSPHFLNEGQSCLNDIIKSISNQIKANARFVGNPSMESSQNIEIHNVSNRYSGIWYSKEVTHSFDSGGYFTEVVFNKKSQNVITNKISAKVNTQAIFKETQNIAEESYRTGAWKYPSQIVTEVKKYREETWKATGLPESQDKRQIWAEQDSNNPGKWTIYEAEVDFETGSPVKKVPVKNLTL